MALGVVPNGSELSHMPDAQVAAAYDEHIGFMGHLDYGPLAETHKKLTTMIPPECIEVIKTFSSCENPKQYVRFPRMS